MSATERGKLLSVAVGMAIVALATGASPVGAQNPATDVGGVSTGAETGAIQSSPVTYPPPQPGSAADLSPSRAPLEAAQPTSVVGKTFIDNSTIPSQNYDELTKFTPSLQNIQPAGPVSQQNYGESIRGLQYNQFNTTFDGLVLPGTVSSFAPQSAVYFSSHDLGSVVIDRGPGTASTIGYATFGGTLELLSKEPADKFTVNPYSTFGSYGLALGGIELDTGAQPTLNGGRGFIDVSRLSTNAALSGVTTERTNGFTKWEQPVGDSTTLTFVGMINRSSGHTAYGATLQQIDQFGPGYGLNSNPKSQAYQGYNTDYYNTDFEYVRVAHDFGDGINLEVTPYTASYYRSGTEGADPNGTTPNLGQPGGTKTIYIDGQKYNPVDDVQGVTKHNDFRDWGVTTRLTADTRWGQIRTGIWVDYIENNVTRANVDFTDGYAVYTTKKTAPQYSQAYNDDLKTVMPYVEYAWKPTKDLTITPGIRFSDIERDLNAQVLKGAPLGKTGHTWEAWQPSVDARYTITPHWTAYAQIAKGFLAPPLNVLQTTNPVGVTPQTTINYQVGTAYQTERLSVGGDLYYIPFNNYIVNNPVAGEGVYSNAGSALYQGIEIEGSYKLLHNLAVIANGSLNDATFKNGAPIYQSPQHTAAGGFVYSQNSTFFDTDNVYGSLLLKTIGKQYGANSSTTPVTAAIPIKSYSNVDLAVGYTLPILSGRKVHIAVNLYNLFNNRSVIGFAGYAGDGATPLYWTDPGFSGFVSLSASL